MSEIQMMCRQFRRKWVEAGKWLEPDLRDALAWMCTEAAEALEAELDLRDFVRNNPIESIEDVSDFMGYECAHGAERWRIAVECFDTVMMACTALDALGMDLTEVAMWKLQQMDKKKSKSISAT